MFHQSCQKRLGLPICRTLKLFSVSFFGQAASEMAHCIVTRALASSSKFAQPKKCESLLPYTRMACESMYTKHNNEFVIISLPRFCLLFEQAACCTLNEVHIAFTRKHAMQPLPLQNHKSTRLPLLSTVLPSTLARQPQQPWSRQNQMWCRKFCGAKKFFFRQTVDAK